MSEVATPNVILLPSSPLLKRLDRFSLISSSSSDDPVPFFDILRAILTSPGPASYVGELAQQLDSIAVTLHDGQTRVASSAPTKGLDFLRMFLLRTWDCQTFFKAIWPACLSLAFEMPKLFPEGHIRVLDSKENPRSVFTRRQIACLVVHQFLCTIPTPSWMIKGKGKGKEFMARGGEALGFADFSLWYSDEPVHSEAVRAYLTALFTYFEKIAMEPGWLDQDAEEWPVVMTLRSLKDDEDEQLSRMLASDPERSRTPFKTLEFIAVPEPSTDPAFLGVPDGAGVVFANKQVGFGAGGTMEEVAVGTTPEACPIVLVTRPLKDDEVLIVTGVESLVVVEGHGRSARLTSVHRAKAPTRDSMWRTRTMLFMDALELDGYDTISSGTLPDLLPGHVDRELQKAYTAFSSGSPTPYAFVTTGLWGCGAFGGNDEVKTMIQWCAAAFAGVPLRFSYSDDRSSFVRRFREFVDLAMREAWAAEEVLEALKSIRPDDKENNQSPLAFVLRMLSGRRIVHMSALT
ncbi:hypothetical protein FRC00_007953 [Tulasnella sp. 408]|nr:hypothetical protein FRC00_007953 [Tulasnella sp. 408]